MKVLKLVLGFMILPVASQWLMQWLSRSREHDISGKVALVTGGSRGLGLLLARELGHAGCRIAICARDEEELEQAQVLLTQWGIDDVLAVQCDVGHQEQVANMIATVEEKMGQIDILVNNAGVIQTGPVTSQTVADFEAAMQIMFWGQVYTVFELLPKMKQRNSGHIINVTSIGGKAGVPHLLPYDAAKFAATGFSEGLSAELGGTNVRVTTVIPGLMRTGSYLNAYFKGQHEKEFTWFGLAANLPFISMDAERAAQQTVRAIKRGDTEIILSLPAMLLARIHGVMPATTIRIMSLVNRLLLPTGNNTTKKRGMEIQQQVQSPLFNFLTTLGRVAARRFNQFKASDPTAIEAKNKSKIPVETREDVPMTEG